VGGLRTATTTKSIREIYDDTTDEDKEHQGWAGMSILAFLKRIEWDESYLEVNGYAKCPSCHGSKTSGHELDCDMAAIIAHLEANTGQQVPGLGKAAPGVIIKGAPNQIDP
jgi:hypothetical protein